VSDLIQIFGSGGGKDAGESHTPVEDPNTLSASSVAYIIDLWCHGPIAGLVDGGRSIYLDGTPLKNEDGSSNFKGVLWACRKGHYDQAPISETLKGFDSVQSSVSVGSEIKKDLPITRTISDEEIDDVVIIISLPGLYRINKKTGDIHGDIVKLQVYVRPDGATEWGDPVRKFSIKGKTNSAYQKQLRIEKIDQYGPGPWEVKIERTTEDSDDTLTRVNSTTWGSYTLITRERFIWPNIAYFAMQAKAKQFGTHIPTRSYKVRGLCYIRMPVNYNPQTREYDGVWDGTFKFGWTNNPAWVWYDLVREDRYGLGRATQYVDKWSLYEIAKWCDESVKTGLKDDEGDDIMGPRFTCNIYIQTQEEAYHLLNALASSFLAMPYWNAGKVTVVADKPADATHLVTPANVVGGKLSYSSTGKRARHSVAYVTWNDPDDHCNQTVEVYEDPELIEKYGYNPTSIVAVGCTQRYQAHYIGKWLIETEKNEKDTLVFRGGLDFGDAVPGCIIKVADPFYAGIRMGGRVADFTTVVNGLNEVIAHAITLDSSVHLEDGETYSLSCVMPDKEVIDRDVLSSSGTRTTINVEPFPHTNLIGAVWVLTATNLAPRYFRVIHNEEVEIHQYEITAIEHDPSKVDRVFSNIKVKDPIESILPKEQIEKPKGLSAKIFSYQHGRNWKVGVLISWRPSTDPRIIIYDVEMKESEDGHWKKIGDTINVSIEERQISPGTYDFRVRGRGVGLGDWAELSEIEIEDPTDEPPAVTGLQVKGGGTNFQGSYCEVVWNDVVDSDYFPHSRFKNYRIKVKSTSDELKRTVYVIDENWRYTISQIKNDFGTAPRSFKIEVAARDIDGRVGEADEITVSKLVPNMAEYEPSVSSNGVGINLNIADSPVDDEDVVSYKVYCDVVSPPETLVATLAANAKNKFIPLSLSSPATCYIQVVPCDDAGDGTPSDIAEIAFSNETGTSGIVGSSFYINTALSDVDVTLSLMRTTGGNFQLAWNGVVASTNKPIKPYDLGINRISQTEPSSPFAGMIWLDPSSD
jgi:predicted phage tail protein